MFHVFPKDVRLFEIQLASRLQTEFFTVMFTNIKKQPGCVKLTMASVKRSITIPQIKKDKKAQRLSQVI